MSDLDTPVVLYVAKELYQAQAIHDALAEQGIPARVEGENLIGVLGDVPLGSTTAPRVMVREADQPAAKAILEELLQTFRQAQAESTTDQVCLSCGTDMTGTETCPKCGWSYLTRQA